MKKSASEKKIAANRANAKKSTGPKSNLGKSKSKSNATKHGAYSTNRLIPGEDEELYEAIKSEQRKIYSPRTFIEKALIDQLVGELMMLKRIARAEYYYIAETKNELVQESLTNSASPIAKFVASPVFAEFASHPVAEKNLEGSEIDGQSKPQKNAALIEAYKKLFIYDETGKMQRLTLIKRTVLQTILGIERDLERRLLQRGNKKSLSSGT